MSVHQLDRVEARRIAIRAQLLDAHRPTDLLTVVDHLTFLQLDPTAASRRGVRAGVPVGIDGPPVWSPDGKKIAMSSRHHGTWVMNADGTGLLRLTRYSSVGLGVSQRPRPAWRPRP